MKKYSKTLFLAVLLGVTGWVTGCTTTNTAQNDPRQVEDHRITSQVKDKLKRDPVFKFRNVQVASASGKVQLSGFTSDAKEKQAAEQIARKIDGVKDVENDIMVQ